MKIKSVLLATCIAVSPVPALANDYLTGYVGWFDLVDQDNQSGQFGMEYRLNPVEYGIRPTIGGNFTGDGAVYGYVGINWDIPMIDNQIYIIPNFMVGVYGDGDGKDLGGPVEFRSGLEMAYQLPNQHRVGVAFNHISNAGIYNQNPGAETLLINYSFPMGVSRIR